MDFKEKKKYLTVHRNCLFKITNLKKQLQKVKDSLEIKGISYSYTPKGNGLTLEELTIEKIDLEERIARLKEENRKRRKIIENALDKMENKKFAEIIDMYYLKGFDDIDISDKLRNHARTIEKNRKKAINQIEL